MAIIINIDFFLPAIRGQLCSGKPCFPGKLSPIPAAMPPVPSIASGLLYKSPGKAEPFRTSRGKAQESVAHKKKIATIAGQIPGFPVVQL